MLLTNVACKNTKAEEKTRRLTDGNGLYLEVSTAGNKYWRMKYRFHGKEKRLAFGVYPEVSLQQAREKRDDARKLLANGQDPSDIKKQQKLLSRISHANTFELVAREWHKTRYLAWSESHAKNILHRLEKDVFPHIGSRSVAAITAAELLVLLHDIEGRGALDVAKRMLQVAGQVFQYAIITGRADRNPAPDLKGALKTVKVRNHAYLREDELPAFLKRLEQYEGHFLTRYAFQLLIRTMVRTIELRGATWSEIDFDKAEWRIPAERMKMGEQHLVPLSTQALALLAEIREHTGFREYIFPNLQQPRKQMSENTLLYALYRMGYQSRATVHGFRATASTILNEHGFNRDVIERQLAHCERDQVRGAYNHAEYLTDRRKLLQWWSDYLDKAASGKKRASIGQRRNA